MVTKTYDGPLSVAEGVHGTFFYHLSLDGGRHSLCGDPVMPTQIPVKTWGLRTHLNERYCSICKEKIDKALADWPRE